MSILSDIDDATSSALSFVLSPIRALLRRGLRTVASWAVGIFHLVGAGWVIVAHGAVALTRGLAELAENTLHVLTWLTRVVIPAVERWAAGELHRIETLTRTLAAQLLSDLTRVATAAANDLRAGLSWVEHTLIAPLEGRLLRAEHELFGDVRAAVDLVLHPQRLIGYLLDAALSDLGHLAGQVGTPVTRWLRRSAGKDVVEFALDLERVLSAAL